MRNPVKSLRFLIWWMVAAVLVWPLVGITSVGVGFIGSILERNLLRSSYDYYLFDFDGMVYRLFTFIGIGILGIIVGAVVGGLQKSLITHRLYTRLKYWRRASIVGAVLGMAAVWAAMETLETFFFIGRYDSNSLYWMLMNMIPMTVFIGVLSAVQWLVLRNYVRSASLWILANAVGGWLFSVLVVDQFNADLSNWLLAILVQAAVTGFSMLWLFHRLRKFEDEDKLEYAKVPVPIEVEDRKPSVWDDAL